MRILYDSKKLIFKDPFGTLVPGQECTLHVHIPQSVGTVGAKCVFCHEDADADSSADKGAADQILPRQ